MMRKLLSMMARLLGGGGSQGGQCCCSAQRPNFGQGRGAAININMGASMRGFLG